MKSQRKGRTLSLFIFLAILYLAFSFWKEKNETDKVTLWLDKNFAQTDYSYPEWVNNTPEPIKGYLKTFISKKIISVDLSFSQIDNLNPLKILSRLKSLTIMNTSVENLTPIAKLTNLQELNLFESNVQSLVDLKRLRNLKILHFNTLQSVDRDIVANMHKLEELSFSIKSGDLRFLEKLTQLKKLILVDSNPNDISALFKLKNLQYLILIDTELSDTQIAKLEEKLPNLKF